MLRHIPLCAVILLSACLPSMADDTNEVFLSLTRKAEPIETLPTNVSTVSSERIAEKDAATLNEALDGETGVRVSKTGTTGQSSTVMIRGSSSEQSLMLIDGRRANSLSLGNADIAAIVTGKIDRVEIIRGAASGIYGANAFGGVINVLTKHATENTPLVDLGISYGSFNTQVYDLNCGIHRDKLSGMIMINKTLSDGWRDNSDFDANDFTANVDYNAGNAGIFGLSGSVYHSEFGVPGPLTGLLPEDFNGSIEKTASTPDARQEDDNQYIQLTHAIALGNDSLNTRIYTSDDKMNYDVPSWFTNLDYDSLTFGAEVQYNTHYGLTVGGEWWEEKYTQDDLITDITNIDRSRVNGAGYIQEEFKWGDFAVTPNVRFDDNSSFGSVLTPRLSAVYHANDALKFSLNSGKAWRAPTFNELYYAPDAWGFSGNPDLKPEEGISNDIGAEYRIGSYRAALTVFQMDTKNLIVWGMKPENVGSSRQRGVEAQVTGAIYGGLSHRLGYTYLWAEDLEAHTQLTYRPQNAANYDLLWLLPWNLKADITAQYVGTQKTESAGVYLPEYTLVNLRLAKKMKDTEVWVKADNVFDTKYETRLGYPLPGTTLAAGINIKFWE